MANLTDITDLTDDALDVLLAVKAGDDCVEVGHLDPSERLAVCRALGVTANAHWICGAPYSAPRGSRPVVGAFDFEGAILDRQEEDEVA